MQFDQMKRREFITLLGGGAAAWPFAARAQQAKVPTIGALVIGNINPEQFWRVFRQGLHDLGYVEGQNIRFEFRSANGRLDRLPELAAETRPPQSRYHRHLVHAHRCSGKASDARNPDRHGRDRRSRRSGVGREPSSAGRKCHRDDYRRRRTGWQKRATDSRDAPVRAPRDRACKCDRSILKTVPRTDPARRRSHRDQDRPDAVIVQPSLPSRRAAELALKHRVPAVSVPRWFAEEGGLMAYSPRYTDLFRKAAVYVDKILKGAQPADLPVEQPTHL